MKLLLRITPMVLVILGLFFIIGCEETEDENPLVGTWQISNLEQTVTYVFVDSSFAPFNYPGDTLAGTPSTVTWAEFSALGVNGTVVLNKDNTFTLDGAFPVASDTLGADPSLLPLTDNGTWTEDTENGTLLIDGNYYDLGGALSWSSDENMITLVYAEAAVDTFVIPVDMGSFVMHFATPLNEISMTTLGFTRQ